MRFAQRRDHTASLRTRANENAVTLVFGRARAGYTSIPRGKFTREIMVGIAAPRRLRTRASHVIGLYLYCLLLGAVGTGVVLIATAPIWIRPFL